jgi:hypothetical protein
MFKNQVKVKGKGKGKGKGTGKGKFFLVLLTEHHAMKAYCGSGCIVTLIL